MSTVTQWVHTGKNKSTADHLLYGNEVYRNCSVLCNKDHMKYTFIMKDGETQGYHELWEDLTQVELKTLHFDKSVRFGDLVYLAPNPIYYKAFFPIQVDELFLKLLVENPMLNNYLLSLKEETSEVRYNLASLIQITPQLEVACALIFDGNQDGTEKILCVSRKDNPNDFGLPGGKKEENESLIQCLKRETFEETGIIIKMAVPIFSQFEGIAYVTTYYCSVWEGTLHTSEIGVPRWSDWDVLKAGSFGQYNASLEQAFDYYLNGQIRYNMHGLNGLE